MEDIYNGSVTLSRPSLLISVAALVLAGTTALAVLWPHLMPAPPIRIGVLHSLTGTMAASEAPLVDAVRLAVEEINAAGGVLGRPVEMVVADGRSDPARFGTEAERLITQEKVSALFACWTSACRKAVKPVVEKHRHLMFYPVQYEGLEQSPRIIYLGAAPNQQIAPGARWALDNFGRRLYLVGSDYIFPRTAHRIVRDIVAAAGGSIVGERYLPLGGTEFGPIAEDIRRLKPDVVLNTINGDSNVHFFQALHAAGLEKMPVVSFSLAEHVLAAMGPEVFHPTHYAAWSYFQSLPTEPNRRFVAAFKARFGPQRVTSDPIEAAYNGVRLWAGAVEETGTETPEHVIHALEHQTVPAPSGVAAIDPATHHLWKRVNIGRALPDGQFEIVHASDAGVRPTPFPPYRSLDAWRRIEAGIAAEARGRQAEGGERP